MRKRFTFILTTLILLTSCLTNKEETPSATNNSDTTKATYSYNPKEYQEETFDTLLNLNTNLRLKIKRHTLMDKGFEVSFEYDDNQKNIIHFRDFEADIKLTNEDKTIYSETIKKENFEDLINDKGFLNQAFLSWVALDGYDKEIEQIKIKCMITMIESDYAYIFMLTIDKQGTKTVELIEIT